MLFESRNIFDIATGVPNFQASKPLPLPGSYKEQLTTTAAFLIKKSISLLLIYPSPNIDIFDPET